MKFEVVIIGGGFAGAYCARTLARAFGAAVEQRCALVSEDNFLTFQPMLPEVAGASLSPLDVVNPLRTFCRGANILHGTVSAVDWKNKTLRLDAGRFTADHQIGFVHLVLAIGSVVDFAKVPGMAQHGLPLKTVADAVRLRAAVIHRLEEANLPPMRQHSGSCSRLSWSGAAILALRLLGNWLIFCTTFTGSIRTCGRCSRAWY